MDCFQDLDVKHKWWDEVIALENTWIFQADFKISFKDLMYGIVAINNYLVIFNSKYIVILNIKEYLYSNFLALKAIAKLLNFEVSIGKWMDRGGRPKGNPKYTNI